MRSFWQKQRPSYLKNQWIGEESQNLKLLAQRPRASIKVRTRARQSGFWVCFQNHCIIQRCMGFPLLLPHIPTCLVAEMDLIYYHMALVIRSSKCVSSDCNLCFHIAALLQRLGGGGGRMAYLSLFQFPEVKAFWGCDPPLHLQSHKSSIFKSLLAAPLCFPSFISKAPWDYPRPAWLIQDNLSTPRQLL